MGSSTKIETALKTSLTLEKQGKYVESLKLLKPRWSNILESPDLEGLSKKESSEFTLRCGAIAGYISSTHQDKSLQSFSLDLLMVARQIFTEINCIEGIAECEYYLAMSYSRTGETKESRNWLEEVHSHNLPQNHTVRLNSFIVELILLRIEKKFEQIIRKCYQLNDAINRTTDNYLKGCFYNQLGLAYKNLKKDSKAMDYFSEAGKYFSLADHQSYLASTENNLAQLFARNDQNSKAFRSAKKARLIFRELDDKTREALSIDTTATILLNQQKYGRALVFADKAIELLEWGIAYPQLIEVYRTKIKLLIELDLVEDALDTFVAAKQTAATQIGKELSDKLTKEFSEHLSFNQFIKKDVVIDTIYIEAFDKFPKIKLLLPRNIPGDKFTGVQIKNSHLKNFGIPKDYIAIIDQKEVRKGDLVVIREFITDEVHCGVYDSEFGIICLERSEAPRLFNQEDVQIIGEIIGYFDPEIVEDGSVQVTMIEKSLLGK